MTEPTYKLSEIRERLMAKLSEAGVGNGDLLHISTLDTALTAAFSDHSEPEGGEQETWSFNVHADGEFAGIWRHGDSGETLLRIGGQPGPPGEKDVDRVRAFARFFATQPNQNTGSEGGE